MISFADKINTPIPENWHKLRLMKAGERLNSDGIDEICTREHYSLVHH